MQFTISTASALYNKADKAVMPDVKDEQERQIHGIVLAELVSKITEGREDCSSDQPLVLKLADLVKMYIARLEQLGVSVAGRIHSTELKNRLLIQFPDMQAHKRGRDVYLAFQDDIALALDKAYNTNFDDEAIILAKAANIIRRDINQKGESPFSGEFGSMCQELSVPQSLAALVAMVLDGPNIASQSSNITAPQAVLTLAQIICYNTSIRRRKESTATFHSTKREPPLPIYIGLMLHAKTRKRGIIEKMHQLGLSISYDRVLQISTDVGNSVCDQFEKDQLVCPPKLRGGLFTTGAAECSRQGFNQVMIRTVDTDVMVIAISTFQQLGISELWIAFGTGKNFRYVPIHDIVKELGPTRAGSLIAFHAFTGCDQTSSFAGRGKSTAWAT